MCVFAAPALAAGAGAATVPLAATAAAAAAPVAASTGLFGLGAGVSNMFLTQLGISALTGGLQYVQQQKVANYQYEAAQRAAESANQAFMDQQEGLNARLREEKQAAEQQKFDTAKKTLQAKGAIKATERAGLTIDLLLADAEREKGNWINALNQTIQSADRQYTRNLKGLEAQRQGRTNQAIDMYNTASANARSLLGTIANVANTGLSNYITYKALAQ
tara:strand:+ start:1965 stop:2621 length:657 start_codon:yes stop_codon:yes gene_type:complete